MYNEVFNNTVIKNKNNNTKKIIIVFIVLCLLTGGHFYYLKKDGKHVNTNDNNSSIYEEDKSSSENSEKNLSINDPLFQELYSYVGAGKYTDSIYSEETDYRVILMIVASDTVVNINNISSRDKNFFGYRLIPENQIKPSICSKHPDVQCYLGNGDGYWCCGTSQNESSWDDIKKTFDDRFNPTQTIEENKLKENVEKIFGSDSYEIMDFTIEVASVYIYDSSSKQYVGGSVDGGSDFPVYDLQLISSIQTNDKIIILENAIAVDNSYTLQQFKIKYTFKLNDDGNYYFYSMEKITE